MRLSGYIRVSRVGGREGVSFISPDLQREQITRWAGLRGVEIVAWHTDLDQTGGKLSRPGLDEAMRQLRAGAIEGIAVARLDRLSRAGVADALRLVAEIHEHGGQLAAVDLGIDPTTPFGEFGLTIMLALARMQRRQITESWEQARKRAVARGVHIASRTPTGYIRAEDGRLSPGPDAGAIRRAFELAARGASWGEIAEAMKGTATPYGALEWTGRSLSHLIANRVYLGEARSGEFRLPGAHEALVDEVTWQAAQRAPGERSARGRSLLAGLVRCAGCRYVLRPDTMALRSGKRVRSYRCRGVRPHGSCEARAAVLGAVIEPWVVEAFFEQVGDLRLRGVASSKEASGASLRLSEAVLERDAYRDRELVSIIGPESYEAGLAKRQARIDGAQAELDRLRDESAIAELVGEADLREMWGGLSVAEQRGFLSSAIDAIFVRAVGRANVPIGERGTILWRGEAPDDLPGPGRRLGVIRPFK